MRIKQSTINRLVALCACRYILSDAATRRVKRYLHIPAVRAAWDAAK